ncbi:hypothetical protein QLX08_011651 [Tetragonisca angustula]|uniref:Uncharacterized protein n=1 Tax=Tetragonisca angustula TaxID=166442 RepID=A0AAW0Z7Y5_9HYME
MQSLRYYVATNSQSELTDLLGFEAMELVEYIIENRSSVVTLNFTVEKKSNATRYFEEEDNLWEGIEKRWRGRRKTGKKNFSEFIY